MHPSGCVDETLISYGKWTSRVPAKAIDIQDAFRLTGSRIEIVHPGARWGLTGKAVQHRCGPATVSGDERRNTSLPDRDRREEAASRSIHEPGDLPG